MTAERPEPDADRLAALLRTAERDAPSPDAAAIERLRETSAAAFGSIVPHSRSHWMTDRLVRLAACFAAACLLFGFWGRLKDDQSPTLGQVLALTAGDTAAGFEGKLSRGSDDGRLLVHGDFWRWDWDQGRYWIGRGSEGTDVNESENLAKPFVLADRTDGRTEDALVSLMGITDPESRAAILLLRPEPQNATRDYYSYSTMLGDRKLLAKADLKTRRLQSIEIDGSAREPRSRLIVSAVPVAIAAGQFVVSDTLTEDGRIGKVADVQGVVALKPASGERWTPVRTNLVLRPNDWVRTEARGANAVELQLVPQTSLILGPGAQAELLNPTTIRLLGGEALLDVRGDKPVKIVAPGGDGLEVRGRQLVRLDDLKIARLDRDPPWLKGFTGATANESLGSLIAKVDGRNVPLTVGYHKVSVDIRDQIARTEIEESFVNSTKEVLEGTFHFPLPQDASIAGFGMWIGNELVEADVVEKQRAREIFETILREKRDPGLLEWTGGNIFKARVYPIPAHGEKRIKITYTQVLPREGDRFRYSYALQSELLRQHPLRELALDVRVSSAATIKDATCPTHPAKIESTANAARVRFTAQQYTPTRDFEVVVALQKAAEPIAVIPHRRGSDGYLLLQLTPPVDQNAGERDLIADGPPLNVLIVADTSASVDAGMRANQSAFIGSLLAALSPKDTFNLATCDVECDWLFADAVPADAAKAAEARKLLAERVSLGWTDLDKAFASVMSRCKPGTQVIYVGDGVITTGSADPVEFAQRLKQLFNGTGTFHAVAVGSSFESGTMRAMAGLGGGSFRSISGERGPTVAALDLLREITRPTLRDLKVEFRGMQIARVYPADLPNLPAGTQQVLLGRYWPEGKEQSGEVIVTGTRGGQPVRWTTPVVLQGAEEGNSFIPRLWARHHLDALLAQGSVAREQVIALSEEFHIMTPYTSFLVLESDADRERFAVKRRFRMSDGEAFFAKGRDDAGYQLAQQQMARAGAWRRALRQETLNRLELLGREPPRSRDRRRLNMLSEFSLNVNRPGLQRSKEYFYTELASTSALGADEFDVGEVMMGESAGRSLGDDSFLRNSRDGFDRLKLFDGTINGFADDQAGGIAGEPAYGIDDHDELGSFGGRGTYAPQNSQSLNEWSLAAGQPMRAAERITSAVVGVQMGRMFRTSGASTPAGFSTLFPSLPAADRERRLPDPPWPAEVLALVKSLHRPEPFARLNGGVRVESTQESLAAETGDLTRRSRTSLLAGPHAWSRVEEHASQHRLVHWCDARERGVRDVTFGLGQVRAASSGESSRPPLDDLSTSLLSETYRRYEVVSFERRDGSAVLRLRAADRRQGEVVFTIDPERRVVTSLESIAAGKRISLTRYTDFIEIAGAWWPRTIEFQNRDGKVTLRTNRTIAAIDEAEFAKQLKERAAERTAAVIVRVPAPALLSAKKAHAAGTATFDDAFALLVHYCASQQWARAEPFLRECERLAGDKAGMRWLHTQFVRLSRRHEEFKARLGAEAERLTVANTPAAYAIAEHLLEVADGLLGFDERFALLDKLKPVYERQPPWLHAAHRWLNMRAVLQRRANRVPEALAIWKRIAEESPNDADAQNTYVRALFHEEDDAAGFAWLDKALARRWPERGDSSLRHTYSERLEREQRYPKWRDFLAAWVDRNPEETGPYDRYLTALVWTDRDDRAATLIEQWVREGQDDKATTAARSRLRAAIDHLICQGYNLRRDRIDPAWRDRLIDLAIAWARKPELDAIADMIVAQSVARDNPAVRRARLFAADLLKREIDTLEIDDVERFLNWIRHDYSILSKDDGKNLIAKLKTRWANERSLFARERLGESVERWLPIYDEPSARLAFVRRRIAEDPSELRVRNVKRLIELLQEQPWSDTVEAELFERLGQLAGLIDADERLDLPIDALPRLVDHLFNARVAALRKTIEHPEQISRTDLRKRLDEQLKQARQGLVDRLKSVKLGEDLAPWVALERLTLEVRLERPTADIAAEIKPLLGERLRPTPTGAVEPAERNALYLQHRFVAILAHLATKRQADPGIAADLRKRLEAAIAAAPDDHYFRAVLVDLLVALDKPDELETLLTAWTKADGTISAWRLVLGYLLAERGKLAEAIELFEKNGADDELDPAAYRALSDWHLALNRRTEHERARIDSFKTTDDWTLHQLLQREANRWQYGGARGPSHLDPEVIYRFAALFAKATSPADHLSILRAFYQTTQDFRLLEVLADAVVGRTAGQVYSMLGRMSPILSDIRDEATVEQFAQRLEVVRARAKSDVDLRALDLLELLVRRRAADLQNQPGPHAAAALAALQRAGKRTWSPGEPVQMAAFLDSLGAPPQSALRTEQLRILEQLHTGAGQGTLDRLTIAWHLAKVLDAHGRRGDATVRIEASVRETQASHGAMLPYGAKFALDTWVQLLEASRQYETGERVLVEFARKPEHAAHARWYAHRLDDLYLHALDAAGTTSLGSGKALYEALERRLIERFAAAEKSDTRSRIISVLCSTYRTAVVRSVGDPRGDLRTFAFRRLPELLLTNAGNYQSMLQTVADTVHDLLGPRDGIAFLLDRMATEPGWVRVSSESGWRRYATRLGQWREEARDIGDQTPRLLKVVTDELRRDLRERNNRDRTMYSVQSSYFWNEQAGEFARVAAEVLSEQKDVPGARVRYVSEYLYYDLHRFDDAIAAMFAAQKSGRLADGDIARLAQWLQERQRFAESIDLLRGLIVRRPDELRHREMLMIAFAQTNRGDDLRALLKETDSLWRKPPRWSEAVAASLADTTLRCSLFAESAVYGEEAIALRTKLSNRPANDGTLAEYYRVLAHARAGLGQTDAAVEAAFAGIVAWGSSQQQRGEALKALREVIAKSKDLDAFIAGYDRKAAETKLDNPVVRKAIGEVLRERKMFAKAAMQLRAALDVQPNDAETHRLLIESLDKAGDAEAVVQQLLAAVQLLRRDTGLYRDLGGRYAKLNRPRDAERAFTSLAEVLPNESEGHAALAEVRQEQGRWAEALAEWEQVGTIRALEPTGLLKQAAVLIQLKRWDEASAALRKLDARSWPSHFGNVEQQVRELRKQLPQ